MGTTAVTGARAPAASLRTMFLGLGGLVVMAIVRTVVVLEYGGPKGMALASNSAEAFLALIASSVALSVAVYLRGQGVSPRPWAFLGMSVGLYGLGSVAWAYLEYTNGVVPYPGVPDGFYIPAYLLLAYALASAAWAYRDIVDIRPGAGIAITVGVVLSGIAYAGLFEPNVLSSSAVTPTEKALSVFYPVADILLLIVPGVALVMVLRRLNAPELAWPWGFVVAGAALLAASDTTFAILAAKDTYVAGGLVDYGWMACHIAFAVGASFEADTAGYRSRRQRMHGNGLGTTRPAASP